MLAQTYSKELRRWIERVRLPSAYCQSCLSDKSPDRDFIYTCELCQGSIHNKHYGREIQDPREQLLDKWYCERCRMICQYVKQQKYDEIEAMKCHFCPNTKGILKRIIFNQSQTIWLHPQCSTWLYPFVSHKNGRKIQFTSQYPTKATGKFWVNLQSQAQAPCQICKDPKGLKLKCMYYTCQKYYHCSCAKTIGLIRDLQSMRFDNSQTYIPPYCQQHLQKRIADCEQKVKKYKNMKNQQGKASHFSQMIATYTAQLKNMQKSAKKYQQQEKIRKQMEYQVGQNEDIMQDLSFEEGQSYQSNHPPEFYQFIFDAEYPKRSRPSTRRPSFLQSNPSKYENQSVTVQSNDKKDNPIISMEIGMLLKKVSENRPGKLQRYSQPQQSEWNSSQQIQEQDD